MRIDADSNGDVGKYLSFNFLTSFIMTNILDWNEFMNYMLIENNTLSSMKKTLNEYVKSD